MAPESTTLTGLLSRLEPGPWLQRRGPIVVWLGVTYAVIAALGRLTYAIPYLLTDAAPWSALDLTYRYEEVHRWFGGLDVYGTLARLLYPPASYAVLWPFLGWLPLPTARVFWAATTLAAAAVIAAVAYRVGRPLPRRERLVIALLGFAAFPVQMALFVGQLPVHAVAFAAAAALLLTLPRPSWITDLAGAALLAAALVKPTLTVPVAAAILTATCRWRPALLAGTVYAGLALAASAAQPGGVLALHRAWLASTAAPELIAEGLPNLHLWLSWLGLHAWATPASLLVLVAFVAWAWRHRYADPWVLVGAAAVVARLWSYHREYDDVVLLLAAIGLLRVWRVRHALDVPAPGVFLAMMWFALLTPTWAFYDLAPVWVLTIQWAHTLLWLAVLVFFMLAAARWRPSTSPSSSEDAYVQPAALGAR